MTNTSIKKRNWINEALLIGGIFLLNFFLVLPKLQPGMLQINAHDGAKYIESGRLLFDWGLRSLAWGPLVSFIYAPIHLFVGDSPNWFMLETWIGNYILFGLLWLSFYALARQLDKYISKYVIIALLFGTTVFFPILENQSDALFIPCSVFALLFLIRFIETEKLKNLWLASLFVGLGILCRFETILLIITLTAIGLIFGLRKHKIFKLLTASWLPIIILLALFFSVSMATFGGLNLGVGNKSYIAFTDNQAFLPGSSNAEAYANGEEIFGTEKENDSSIFKAIIRNPLATGERILANILNLPNLFLVFFGKLQGPVFASFALIGLIYLIKERATKTLLVLLIWPMHAMVALIFLTRHIIPQMSYLFFILAAIGLTYLLKASTPRRIWVALFGVFVLIIGVSIFTDKPAFLASGILLAVAALAGVLDKAGDLAKFRIMPAIILLIGMISFGGAFSFPSNEIGLSQDELGAQQIMSAVPANAHVLAPYHTVAIAGKATSFLLPTDINTLEEFLAFLSEKDIQGVYVDPKVPYTSDVVLRTINAYPDYFELHYQSDEGNIRFYLFN